MYLASVKRLSISRPVHLSSMNLDEEEEEDDLFSRLWVLLTSIAYLNSTPFRSCEPWLYCRLLVKCITHITWFLSKDEGYRQQLVANVVGVISR